MSVYVYDLEIYPNLFTATFVDVKTSSKSVFFLFNDEGNMDELTEFIAGVSVLIGYNSMFFDNPILNAAVRGWGNKALYNLVQEIIGRKFGMSPQLKVLMWEGQYKTIDLMKLLALDIGLKQVGVTLSHKRIQDLPLPPATVIEEAQIDKVLEYNLNDVLITKALYENTLPEIKMRDEVGAEFELDLTNASRSQIGNLILEKFYQLQTGLSPMRFKDLRTYRETVMACDCIGRNIEFTTSELKNLLSEIKSLKLTKKRSFKFKIKLLFANKKFEIGVGGLHTKDDPGVYRETRDRIILDADVDSFYPAIMLLNNIKPKHLKKDFITIFRRMTDERLEAKRSGDKYKSEGLKITINSTIGKFASDTFWLYDPLAFFSVTLSGQLYLMMLVERLHLAGFEILSANTDGVIASVSRKREGDYYKVMKDWERDTGFSLSFTAYNLYARRDVNSYIARSEKIKTKGFFATPHVGMGWKSPILGQAIADYFLSGVSIEETIVNCRDIHQFLISQKTGKKFTTIFRDGGKETICQKTNRFYVSVKGGRLVKRAGNKEITIHSANVILLNDIPKSFRIRKAGIDYNWYICEAEKTASAMEPAVVQGTLF